MWEVDFCAYLPLLLHGLDICGLADFAILRLVRTLLPALLLRAKVDLRLRVPKTCNSQGEVHVFHDVSQVSHRLAGPNVARCFDRDDYIVHSFSGFSMI